MVCFLVGTSFYEADDQGTSYTMLWSHERYPQSNLSFNADLIFGVSVCACIANIAVCIHYDTFAA